MVTTISYIFSILILVLSVHYGFHSKKFFHIDKSSNGITFAWIFIYLRYSSYMFAYCEYNHILDIGTIILYFLYWKAKITNNYFFRYHLLWYSLFLFWCIFSLFYTKSPSQWLYMFIKLIVPFFVFYFSYNAFSCKKNIWLFYEKMSYMPVLLLFLTLISLPIQNYLPVYLYFGMAVMIFPFILYLKTKKKKYLLYCALCLSANVIYVKRTPLLGMFLMLFVYFIYKYKYKALLPIVIGVGLLIVSIIYIPFLRERVFFEGADITIVDFDILLSPELFSKVNTNGRSEIWEVVIERFFNGHEIMGSGLGTMKEFLLSKENDTGFFLRLHNDWLHLLCETGCIGCGLLLMMFGTLFKETYKTYRFAQDDDTKLIALSCAMASIGTFIHMLLENCIGVFGYYIPFVFSAIYFRYLKFNKQELQNEQSFI